MDQVYSSSVSRKASLSSDEDGDIYCQTGRDVTKCAHNKTGETCDGPLALEALNRGLHKPEQVGIPADGDRGNQGEVKMRESE